MIEGDILTILKQVNALITHSHIVLVSGRHSNAYINPDKILPHTSINDMLGKMFAKKLKHIDMDVIIGPAYGGVIFSQWAAFHLSKIKKKEISSIFTEKTPERHQIFERGFDKLVKNKKVVIVEDVTATGSSVKKVINAVIKAEGKVVAVCVIVNRDAELVNSETLGIPFFSLAEYKIESFDATICPLCKKNVPINIDVGHGKKFIEELKKNS